MTNQERLANSKFTFMVNGDLEIEGAVLKYKNFEGRPTDMNPAGGKRTCCVVLNEAIAEKLSDEGWNVKTRTYEDGGSEHYTEVVINMESKYPPRVNLIEHLRGRDVMRKLDSETIAELDDVYAENVDIIIHPYEHGRPGQYKIKGYVRDLCVTEATTAYFGGKYDNVGSSEDYDAQMPFN